MNDAKEESAISNYRQISTTYRAIHNTTVSTKKVPRNNNRYITTCDVSHIMVIIIARSS